MPYKDEQTCCLFSLRARLQRAVKAGIPSAPPRTTGKIPKSRPMATDHDCWRWRSFLNDVLPFCRAMALGLRRAVFCVW